MPSRFSRSDLRSGTIEIMPFIQISATGASLSRSKAYSTGPLSGGRACVA